MSTRLAFRFLCSLLLGLASLRAGDTEPPAAAPKPPPYVLHHKSSFTALGEDERAPFWPIGWTKRRPVTSLSEPVRVAEAPKVLLEEKSFKVSSILLGNPSLAIINGRTYSEGEFLRMARTAPALPSGLRVRVYRIHDGAVLLQNQEQILTVALARPVLSQRRDEEVLLLEDRP